MNRPIITLTTDFGASSPFVAQMKGVILTLNPEVNIVDICHAIPPQDVRQGARVLDDVTRTFPAETIHVAVVDPGVGTDRRIIYSRVGNQHFIAPDNGLLGLISKRTRPSRTIALTNREYWLQEVSNTFHGRDIMAPAAAYLSRGISPDKLGEPAEALTKLTWPDVQVQPREILGSIVSFDSFGNLLTDIPGHLLVEPATSPKFIIHCGTHEVREVVRTYASGIPGSLIALTGSSGMLELSIVNGNAARMLGVEVDDAVRVVW